MRVVPAIHVPAIHVVCTNCGGSGSDWIALLSLVFAILAVIVAGIALAWSRSEHREFLERLRARARLDVTLRTVGMPLAPDTDDSLAITGAAALSFPAIFEVGVTNEKGDRAAGVTTVNVLVPTATPRLYWCNGFGQELALNVPPLDTSETITRNGVEVPARWISQQLPRVSTRTPQLLHFAVQVGSNENRIPIRVKAQCDELPDDIEEASRDFELKVHDLRPPYGLRQ